MVLPDAHLPRQVTIDGYGPGFFHFAGMASEGSILALPSGIHTWSAVTPADIGVQTLGPVLAQSDQIDMLIIGTGLEPWAVPDALRWRLRDAGIGIDAMPTRAAAATYNVLLAEGRLIAAALLALR